MNDTAILIVEDEAIVAADVANRLRQLGYRVAGSTAQGTQAIEMTERLHPDLVLMDIQLEGSLDGIQTAETIQSLLDVPVVYLTAHSDAATLSRAKLTGPFGYILKPFEDRDLGTQIELALNQHKIDRQLREQREWLRVTLTSIGDAVIATDADGCISFLNPVAEALTGWSADVAQGQPISHVFRVVNEQTGLEIEELVPRVLREGRAIPLANHAALVTRDGRQVPIEDSAAPIMSTAGKVIGAVLVFHDVTDKRRAREALERSNQELEQFAYVASHDLQEPLRAIVGFLQLLESRYGNRLDKEGRHFIERSVAASHRMQDLIRDLLRLSRLNTSDTAFVPTDLNRILERALENIQTLVKVKRAAITHTRLPELPADASQIQRLFENLISNGVKYNQDPIPTIVIGCDEYKDVCRFTVRDNGIGIAPHFHERIFKVFQRLHTDREYSGTGMGLALCKKIVERHGGTIGVESSPQAGSTFYFTLPRSR
ncbi:MAG: ATP-binding protein [Desulfosarcina sp.]